MGKKREKPKGLLPFVSPTPTPTPNLPVSYLQFAAHVGALVEVISLRGSV